MNLQDIFDELTYGELSQISIGGRENEEPGICEKDRPALIRHINTALTAIYTRFRLSQKELDVLLTPGKSTYVLDRKFLINNTASSAALKYLVDTEDDLFEDSLIKVESVWALREELGMRELKNQPYQELILNEQNNPYSVRTPSIKTLLVPDHFDHEDHVLSRLRVKYRARHKPIDLNVGASAPLAIEIELPATHLQALLFHVASRIMNPSGMIEEFNAGNTWYAKYEGEAARLELENVQVDNMQSNNNFSRQGFV